MGESFGVVGGPENSYGVVWRAEGFHALVGLLTVIESGCHAMQAEVGVSDEGGRGPLAGFD